MHISLLLLLFFALRKSGNIHYANSSSAMTSDDGEIRQKIKVNQLDLAAVHGHENDVMMTGMSVNGETSQRKLFTSSMTTALLLQSHGYGLGRAYVPD